MVEPFSGIPRPAGPPELQVADGLQLRQLTADDAEAMFRLVDDNRPHLSRFGEQIADKYPTVNCVRDSLSDAGRWRFGIWANCTGRPALAGVISLLPVPDTQLHEVGYWLGAEHTGQGYARRSLSRLAEQLFKEDRTKGLLAYVAVGNTASVEVVRAADFKLHGRVEAVYCAGSGVAERPYWFFSRLQPGPLN